MNSGQQSKTNWLVIGGIGLFIILLLLGYRISNISFNLGPVSVDVAKPTKSAPQVVENTPVSQVEQPVQNPEPATSADFNPPVSLPFSDNFDGGLSSEWRITKGDQVVVDGGLQTLGELTIEIGNNDLSSYQLDFDCCGGTGKTTVTIGRKLRFWFMDCGINCGYGGWEGYSDGVWQQMERFDLYGTPGHFTLVVAGSSCQLYVSSGTISNISYSDLSGPVSLTLQKDILSPAIDNVEIK